MAHRAPLSSLPLVCCSLTFHCHSSATPMSRVCVGCQRSLSLWTSARKELIEPRWQRLFRTLHLARPSSCFHTLRVLARPPATHKHHRYHSTAARSLSASTLASLSAILPSSASEWRAIRSGHVAEPLTAIVVTGAAASTWLQGLITADMTAIDRQQYGYTAALNFKGRVVFTALVLKLHSDQSTYHLLLPSTVAEAAVTHLNKLNFRRKVSITTQPATLHHILPSSASATSSSSSQPSHAPASHLPDPRSPLLGSVTMTDDALPLPLYHSRVFELLRHLHCIPAAGSPELAVERSLPLDCNLDHLHAIAFDKGCYIGQEVTARAHFTGTIRKRLYAAYLTQQPHTDAHTAAGGHRLKRLAEYRSDEGTVDYEFIDFDVQLPAVSGEDGAVGVMAGGKEVGKLYTSCYNVAIVQLRIESVERGDRLTVTVDGKEYQVTPYELDWWPTEQQQQSKDEKGTLFLRNQPSQ